MKKRQELIFLSCLMGFLGVLCYLVAQPLLGPALFACLMAVAFYPVHRNLVRRIRRPTMSALLSTLMIYALILLPLTFVAITVGGEIVEQYGRLKEASAADGGVGRYLQRQMNAVIGAVAPRLQMEEPRLAEEITSRLESGANWIAKSFASGLLAFGSFITNAVLAMVILFFFLRDGEQIRAGISDIIPLKKDDSEHLLCVIRDTIQANLHGVIGVAVVQGGLLTIGLLIAGVPSPFTWGVIGAVCSMIPMVGTALVWVPAVLWLLTTGSYGVGIFLAIWGVLVGLADNLLRPLMVGGETNQHPMLVFVSILGGMSAFGMMGLFLGPLLISTTIAVFAVFRREVSTEAKS
jgi:predicted PurR-regulated permease PerM